MLHSGKPWVAGWQHWNYSAVIKATEVCPLFIFVYVSFGSSTAWIWRRWGLFVVRWR
jgi:hypothetical protein